MNVDFRIKKENPRIVETTTKMKVGTTIDNEVVPDATGGDYTVAGEYTIGGSDFVGKMRSIGYTDGKIVTELSTRNMTTAGIPFINYISLGARKDGTNFYSIADPVAFKDALNIKSWHLIKELPDLNTDYSFYGYRFIGIRCSDTNQSSTTICTGIAIGVHGPAYISLSAGSNPIYVRLVIDTTNFKVGILSITSGYKVLQIYGI